MAKTFRCNVLKKDCPWYARADTEEELMKKIKEHAEEVHGIGEITDELLKEIKSVIKDE